jgi:predicted Zn-dependent protease
MFTWSRSPAGAQWWLAFAVAAAALLASGQSVGSDPDRHEEPLFSGQVQVPAGKRHILSFTTRSYYRSARIAGSVQAVGGSANDIRVLVVKGQSIIFDSGKRRTIVMSVDFSEPGQYTLIFDNTFSLVSAKVVSGTVSLVNWGLDPARNAAERQKVAARYTKAVSIVRKLYDALKADERVLGTTQLFALPKVQLVDDGTINARANWFENALYINTGVFDFTDSAGDKGDDVLAAILAHELSHIFYRHPGYGSHPGVKGLFDELRGVTALDRVQEKEADVLGIRVACQAGFDPNGMLILMSKFAASDPSASSFMRNHPSGIARLNYLQAEPAKCESWQAKGRGAQMNSQKAVEGVAGTVVAQTTIIQGKVIGEDGAPLKGAVIQITRTDIPAHYSCETNESGEYFYGGLQIGNYDVVVKVDGVVKDSINKVRSSTSQPLYHEFDLHRIRMKNDAMNRAASTGGQLTNEQKREMTPEQIAAFEKAKSERAERLSKDKGVDDAYNAGMQAFDAKLFDVAVEMFKKAAEANTNPTNTPVILAHLAQATTSLAATKTGEDRDVALQQAIDAWGRVIAAAPNAAAYHNNYGLALARAGKLTEAEVELLKAAAIDPAGGGRYFFNLGALLVNVGKTEEATAAFKRAIDMAPSYAEAYFQYANCLMAKAQTTPDGKTIPPPGAKEAYEQYLALTPTGPNSAGAKAMLNFIAFQAR